MLDDIKNTQWVESERPKTIEECILPAKLKAEFQAYVDTKEFPNLLLAGGPGVGKTTVARAMCEEMGCDYLFINGSSENGIDTFRGKITNYASSVSLSGGRKVIIIDEADGLNPNSMQPALRSGIEEFSKNCSFIFTCNHKNRIIAPISQSRLAVIDFKFSAADKPKLAVQFMKRVEGILTKKNIPYDKQAIITLITKYFPDNRRILNELQRYSKCGKIDAGILAEEVQISELIETIKTKDFTSARKWVGKNSDTDASTIYRLLYDGLVNPLKPDSLPQIILLLAKYQYQAAFVADPELNLMACVVEIMADGEFK